MDKEKSIYESPLSARYASRYMLELFSQDTRVKTWRSLWIALAEGERRLGLPITSAQIEELTAHIDDIDYAAIAKKEKEVRHDVMAHIYGFGLAAPSAKAILHMGATSCYVTDNADLILYRDALLYLKNELLGVLKALRAFALRYKALPTLGYTHFQPAQPVTVGKRAALWIQDFLLDLDELDFTIKSIRFLGSRGTTGTEASFLELFGGNDEKADALNSFITTEFGFESMFPVTGQTYPRKLDSRIMNALSAIAQSAYRFASDIRLLQHERELEEPFEEEQIGSSAMAYKRNPMRCERVCSLARYVMADAQNAVMTASSQWLERTLDDSANRRIALPEAFLAIDAVLRLVQNVAKGLVVNEKIIEKNLNQYLPFLVTENLLMAAVKKGGDRQVLHEVIRTHSMAATARMKDGEPCDLLERLQKDPAFPLDAAEIAVIADARTLTGRAEVQVERFIETLPDLHGAEDTEDLSV
ncbi:MAG TPA: adenylosuccinate lyase [Clostridia bacterium]|nr:adenylosuccinate lyase [Clostridia bacterium]